MWMTEALDVLGVKLDDGRDLPQDIQPPKMGEAAGTTVPQVLVTRVLADALFPDGQAVGKGVYAAGPFLSSPAIITGVIEDLDSHTVNPGTTARTWPPAAPPLSEETRRDLHRRGSARTPGASDEPIPKSTRSPDPDRFIEWIHPLNTSRTAPASPTGT